MDLQKIMDDQVELQNEYYPEIQKKSKNQQMLINIEALYSEVDETHRELNWKHWKKEKPINWENVKNEITDQLIFVLNQANISGMTAAELIARTYEKQALNRARQKNGY